MNVPCPRCGRPDLTPETVQVHWYSCNSWLDSELDELDRQEQAEFDAADTIPDGRPAFGRYVVVHEPGCHTRPRNPRGCDCGRDHQ